jgi:ABC-type dipeptide/oligopeptide/nickel transport system ATPase component
LLVSVREALSLSMLFITHDLGVVRQVADRVAVMRRGELVESADAQSLFAAPQHEYTRELLAAAVDLDMSR